MTPTPAGRGGGPPPLEPLRFEYLEKIRKALAAADIENPFPHLQLFIDEATAFRETPLTVRLERDAK